MRGPPSRVTGVYLFNNVVAGVTVGPVPLGVPFVSRTIITQRMTHYSGDDSDTAYEAVGIRMMLSDTPVIAGAAGEGPPATDEKVLRERGLRLTDSLTSVQIVPPKFVRRGELEPR